MTTQITLDPKDFSEQILLQAIHGEYPDIKPQIGVVLLRAKLGAAAEPHLTALASDEKLDSRIRLTVINELANYKGAKTLLKNLSQSTNSLISQSAAQALRMQE